MSSSNDITNIMNPRKYKGFLLTDEECDEIVNKAVTAFKENLDQQVDKIIKDLKEKKAIEAASDHQKFLPGSPVMTPYWNSKLQRQEWSYDIYSHYNSDMGMHLTIGGLFKNDEVRNFDASLLGNPVEG